MRTIETLNFLAENGLDIDINDIENNADVNTREKYEVNEPIHKWDGYYLGDADEDVLNEVAKKQGFDNYDDLLSDMDNYFLDELDKLASEKLEKMDPFTVKVEKVEQGYPHEVSYFVYTNNKEHAISEYEDYELIEEFTSHENLFRFKKTEKELFEFSLNRTQSQIAQELGLWEKWNEESWDGKEFQSSIVTLTEKQIEKFNDFCDEKGLNGSFEGYEDSRIKKEDALS